MSDRARGTIGVGILMLGLLSAATRATLAQSSRPVRPALSGHASAPAQPGRIPAARPTDRGRQIYTKGGCYQCHGREGQGASTGSRLGPEPIAFEAFERSVRAPRGEMPPYTVKVLSDQELAEIYAFLQALPPPAPGALSLLK